MAKAGVFFTIFSQPEGWGYANPTFTGGRFPIAQSSPLITPLFRVGLIIETSIGFSHSPH